MPKFTTFSNLLVDVKQSLRDSPVNDQITELGTRTLDNRDYWENNNFNESTLNPYLTGNKETLDSEVVNGIVYRSSIGSFTRYQYSIDALPFVTDPNDGNEIIRVDNYYDKVDNSNEYNLATEGKISFYIYTRENGRPTPDGNIDNYVYRQIVNKFDGYANTKGDTGFYLFKLNWGDGTEIEYTDNPKLLESTVLLYHTYKKPGFYTISGVVYALYSPENQQSIGGWEKFETKILLNPSKNYELNLYDYDNFATIGGITNDSVLVKSAVNLVGINPNNFNDERATLDSIEKINLLDRLQLFNFINKVSDNNLNKFNDFLLPFTEEFQQQQRQSENIYGCTNSEAVNYNGSANTDDESCIFDIFLNFIPPSNNSQVFLYNRGSGDNWDNIKWDYTIPSDYDFHDDIVYNSGQINSFSFESYGGLYSLNTMKESNTFIIINITNLESTLPLIDNNFQLTPLNFSRTQQNIWSRNYENGWYKLEFPNVNSPSVDFNGELEVAITSEGENSDTQTDEGSAEPDLYDVNLTLNNVGGSSNNFANIVNTYGTIENAINGQYYEESDHTIKINFSDNHYLEALTSPTHPDLNFNFVDAGQPNFEFQYERWSFFMPSGDVTIHAQVSTALNPTIYDGRIGIDLTSTNDNYGLPAPVGGTTEVTLDGDNQSVQLNATPEIDTNDWNYEFDKWVIPNSKSPYIGFGDNRTLESQSRTPILHWKSSALDNGLPRTVAIVEAHFTRTGATSGTDNNTGGGNTGGGNKSGGGKTRGGEQESNSGGATPLGGSGLDY